MNLGVLLCFIHQVVIQPAVAFLSFQSIHALTQEK